MVLSIIYMIAKRIFGPLYTDKVNNIIMIVNIDITHNLQGQLGKNYYFDINLIYLTIFFEIEVNSRARETRARVKITPREKGDTKIFLSSHRVSSFSRGMIFMRARASLALLSLRTNGGLLVVYVFLWSGEHCFELQLITSQ